MCVESLVQFDIRLNAICKGFKLSEVVSMPSYVDCERYRGFPALWWPHISRVVGLSANALGGPTGIVNEDSVVDADASLVSTT